MKNSTKFVLSMSALALMAAEAATAGFTGSPPAGYSQFTAYDLSGVSVVPAPGALALLGVAGFASRRRRA